MNLETIKIKTGATLEGFMIINKSEFDAASQEIWTPESLQTLNLSELSTLSTNQQLGTQDSVEVHSNEPLPEIKPQPKPEIKTINTKGDKK